MKLRTLIACDILLRNPQNHVSIVKFIGLCVNYLRFIPPKFLLSPLFWIIPCTCKTCMNLSWTYGSIIGNIWNDEIITWLRYDFTQPVQLTLDFIYFPHNYRYLSIEGLCLHDITIIDNLTIACPIYGKWGMLNVTIYCLYHVCEL